MLTCVAVCFWSFANAVEEDTRMVSLSELESIFITLRLMDADQVYENKQVLVVLIWNFLFWYYQTVVHEPRLCREGQEQ